MKKLYCVMMLMSSIHVLGVTIEQHWGKLLTSKVHEKIQKLHPGLAKMDPKHLKLRGSALKEGLKEIEQKIAAMDPVIMKLLRGTIRKVHSDYPHKKNTARVKTGAKLHPSEIAFIRSRMPKIQQSLKEKFGITTNKKVPRIAFCGSGGGYRAMLSTLGFLIGAQKIGLLDCTLYNAGLSGSTWIMGPWSYLNTTKNMNLEAIKDRLKSTIRSGFQVGKDYGPSLLKKPITGDFMTNTLKRFGWDQKLSLIDIWGSLIGNEVLAGIGVARLNATWSSIAGDLAKNVQMPFPICTSVHPRNGSYDWFEYTPYEVGSQDIKAYVPTWAFGRKFEGGKTVKGYQGFAPEYPFAYLLGIFGSAFEISLNKYLKIMGPKNDPELSITIPFFGKTKKITIHVPISKMLEKILKGMLAGGRPMPAQVYNIAKGFNNSPVKDEDYLILIDAGRDFNLPLPPLMRPGRDIDVIVMFDASLDIINTPALLKAAQWANEKHHAFPKIPSQGAQKAVMSVFNDPRKKNYSSKMPVVIYFPLYKNPKYPKFNPVECRKKTCSTENFKYSSQVIDDLTGYTEFAMTSHKKNIAAILKELVNKKK